MLLNTLLGIVMLLVTAAIGVEIAGWFRGTKVITQWQKFYRISCAAIMDAVILMVIFGSRVNGRGPVFELSYWGLTVILSFTLVFLALLDLRTSLLSYEKSREAMIQDLLKEEEEQK